MAREVVDGEEMVFVAEAVDDHEECFVFPDFDGAGETEAAVFGRAVRQLEDFVAVGAELLVAGRGLLVDGNEAIGDGEGHGE